MNQTLLKEIVTHIFSNFAIIPSSHVDLHKTESLMSSTYLLPIKINLLVEDDYDHNIDVKLQRNVWGCQLSVAQNEIKVLLGDFSRSSSSGLSEFAMVIQSKDAPVYGLYLIGNGDYDNSALAISIEKQGWMMCSTFLQATFLAAMEQVKDLRLPWNKCSQYNDLYKDLLSLSQFYDEYFESVK